MSQGNVFLRSSPRVQWIKSFFSQAAGNRHYSWPALRPESLQSSDHSSFCLILCRLVYFHRHALITLLLNIQEGNLCKSPQYCVWAALFSDSVSVLWIQAGLAIFYSDFYVSNSWNLWPRFPFPLLSLDTLKSISWEIVGFISSVSSLRWFKAFCLFFVVDLFWWFQLGR